MKRHLMTVLLAGALAACSQGTDTPEPATDTEEEQTEFESKDQHTQDTNEGNTASPEKDLSQAPVLPDIPDEITKTVVVEGMEEKRKFEVIHHIDLGFSTYIPVNMITEKTKNSLHLFSSDLEGEKLENVTYQLTKTDSETAIKEALENKGFDIKPTDKHNYPDSVSEFYITKNSVLGYGRIIEHNDQRYAIVYYYPGEFGDGFEPTVQAINEEIIWHDELR